MLPAWRNARLTTVCLGAVLLLAFGTYFLNFHQPQAFVWDENYHVPNAQKYLNGIFFMEQHPPLGKMVIALGEALFDFSPVDNQFTGTEYAAGDFKDGFVITGYRIFPAFLAWMTAPLLFGVFLIISGSPIAAMLLSSLYVFDNALIVHTRGAMLEGPLIFFMSLTILLFLLLLRCKEDRRKFTMLSAGMGLAFSCVVTTKLTGWILLLLFPLCAFALRQDFRRVMRFLGISFIAFALGYCSIWYAHFAMGQTVNPAINTYPDLNHNGWYYSSDEYRAILAEKKTASLLSFPVMLRDSLRYVGAYNGLVPRLDLCKPDERGSPFFLWPLGARAVQYRWSTPGNETYRYLYLQSNPLGWACGLFGVLSAFAFAVSTIFFRRSPWTERSFLIWSFLILYCCYMFAVSRLDRVMYLYHYLPPLIFSFILFALMLEEIRHVGTWEFTPARRRKLLIALSIGIFGCFVFFSPLTYFKPLTDEQLARREWLSLWGIHCARCEQSLPYVIPRQCPAAPPPDSSS